MLFLEKKLQHWPANYWIAGDTAFAVSQHVHRTLRQIEINTIQNVSTVLTCVCSVLGN